MFQASFLLPSLTYLFHGLSLYRFKLQRQPVTAVASADGSVLASFRWLRMK